MEQLSFMPRKIRKQPKPLSEVEQLVRLYNELRGPLIGQIEWNKSRRMAKNILESSSLEEAKATLEWLHQHEYFKTKPFSLAVVGRHIKDWKIASVEQARQAAIQNAVWGDYKDPEA